MEDIRTYLDSTGGQYHKGETHSAAILAGLICFFVGTYWILLGLYFLVYYAGSFDQVAGSLELGAATSLECWVLASLRVVQGCFFLYIGVQAWDMRKSFLYWVWIIVPCYVYFWGGFILELDPEFRAAQIIPENLFTYPALGGLLFSMLLMVMVLPLVTLASWVFRPSPRDPHPLVLAGIVAAVYFGFTGYTSEIALEILMTPAVYCIAPLDHPSGKLPLLKLIALSPTALRCHGTMDKLKEALEKRQSSGSSINIRNWGNRPKGERLIRMLQQAQGLDSEISCGDGGYYSIFKEDGRWRCSQHGDRLSPEDRRVGMIGNDDAEYEE